MQFDKAYEDQEKMLKTGLNAHAHTHRQTDGQKWKQYIRQFHSVHLADITMLLSRYGVQPIHGPRLPEGGAVGNVRPSVRPFVSTLSFESTSF